MRSCSAIKTQGKEKQGEGNNHAYSNCYTSPIFSLSHSRREGVRGWVGVWLLVGVNSPQIINFLKEMEERTFRYLLYSSPVFQGEDKFFPLKAATKNTAFTFLPKINQNPVFKNRLTKQLSSAVFTSFKERNG